MSTDDQTPEPERTDVLPVDAPTETLDVEPSGSATPDATEPLRTSGPVTPAGALPDWREAQSAEEARAAAGAPPASTSSAPGAGQTWSGAPAAPAPGDQPVWTAASTAPGPNGELPEAPFRSVRVGQLIWAGIVMVIGVFLIGMALIRNIDVPFLLIGLIAVLGFGLIIAAVATSRRKR